MTTLSTSAASLQQKSVNFTKIFGDAALPFVQVVYESTDEFLSAVNSSINEYLYELEYNDDNDQYCIDANDPFGDLWIESTMCQSSDNSYNLTLNITFKRLYRRGFEEHKAMPTILKEIRTIYKYDYDGQRTGNTIEAFIRVMFDNRRPSLGNRWRAVLTDVKMNSDYVIEQFPHHYATFRISFVIKDLTRGA